jgi:hypothetical protein
MPTNYRRAACRVASSLALVTLAVASPALAQDSKSSTAAKQLAETMDRLKLDSIAAMDPSEKDTFVAALYFQGAQLLVVSAQYTAPSLLVSKLEKKEYRDTYIDLNAASVPASKIFVMDHGADGLMPRPGDSQGADSWEQANKTTAFDGDWRRAKITEDEYLKSFSTADERYARMLTLLAEQARKSGS